MGGIGKIFGIVQVVSALAVIGLVLVQQGKGADMGAAFGSGASGSLFGASGSSSFLSKATGLAATLFFICTLGLAYLSNKRPSGEGVMQNVPAASASVVETKKAESVAVPTAKDVPETKKESGVAGQIPK